MSNIARSSPTSFLSPALLLPAVAVAGLAYAFLPTIEWMVEKWTDDPQYSHGFLVPFFSAFLVWRAAKAGPMIGSPRPLLGGLVLALLVGVRWLAGGLLFHQLDAAALLLSALAGGLAVGGFKLVRKIAPAVGFLVFMIPLPYELEQNVGQPLKVVATEASTFLLQTLGLPAVAEGHVILIDEVRLGVVDACSGLKMLMTFSAFAVGAVLTLDRTRFEKFMVLLGIVPIAVVTNVLRITATGVAYTYTAEKDVQHFLHDLHGWLMMPAGLGLLAGQLWVLARLVVRPAAPLTDSPGFALTPTAA